MMQENIAYFYQLTLLCRSVSYSAESIIQLMSITRFPCNHRLPPNQPLPIIGRWAARSGNASATAIEQRTDADMPINSQSAFSMEDGHEGAAEGTCQTHPVQSEDELTQIPTTINQETSESGKPGFFPCKQCSEKQREHRMYLVGRLLDAVEAGEIDLWDSELAKKQRLPANRTLPNFCDTLYSNDVIRWMLSGSLTNEDLIKFCRSEKIKVAFKYDPSVEQATKQESSITALEPVAEIVPVVTIHTPSARPPGRMPNVGIGKLAIKTAWEIECKTGHKASASDVIARLKEMVKNKESELLTDITSHGVIWMTSTFKEKKYDQEACRKTLNAWHDSRA